MAGWLTEQLARVSRGSVGLVTVGPVVNALSDLQLSARVARQVLEAAALKGAAAQPPASGGLTVLTAADVPDALTLILVADLLAPMAQTIAEPLEALRQHDSDHGTTYVDTVAAVLAHPGNLAGAARELGIHANSLRYRLERIGVISGIELQSAVARLRVGLGLLMWERDRGHRAGPPVESDDNPGPR